MPYRRTADRIEHTEAVRGRILSAARRIISTEGIDALKIRSIVSMAETSTGNYYFYFKDKQTLVMAIVEELAAQIAGRIDRVSAGAQDESGRLAAMVYTGVRSILADRGLATVLYIGSYGDNVRSLVAELFVKRTVNYFSTVKTPAPVDDGITVELLAHLWQGSILFTIEKILDGNLRSTDDQAASGCAVWNLSAIGYEPVKILESVEQARKSYKDLLKPEGFE